MSNKNRSTRIQLLQKVLAKQFLPVQAPKDRNVLEHLVYASCLEDAPYESADEAFHRLQESFFDWNEVRVTTVTELIEHLQNLPNPKSAAMRVKKNLQSIFEARYSFDLEDLIKMNQGKAIGELEKLGGMSRFVLNYVTQNALGGHAIPVGANIMKVLLTLEIVSEAEAAKNETPGLERTVSKAKGAEFGSCLHQLGLMVAQSPNSKTTKAVLKDAGAPEPKKATKEIKQSAVDKKASASKSADKTAASAKAKPAPSAKSQPPKKAQPPKKVDAKKSAASKSPASASPNKKAAPKKSVSKAAAPKRKPR